MATSFDVLTSTMGDITRLLDDGKLASVDLVKAYATQIKTHNYAGAKLHAMISMVPEQTSLAIAHRLYEERSRGNRFSPLHGIPFIAKIQCGQRHRSCANNRWQICSGENTRKANCRDCPKAHHRCWDDSYRQGKCLGTRRRQKHHLHRRLFRSRRPDPIRLLVGGIDPSDSWLGHSNPAGSSTGSAVAVSAGMAPVALGTEADSSTTTPSDRAALYSVRLSPDALSRHGVHPYNGLSDSLGAMTKSPEDVALMLNTLLGNTDYTRHLTLTQPPSFTGLKIGFLDPVAWAPVPAAVKLNPSYNTQYLAEFNTAVDKIAAAAAIITRNVTLRKITPQDDAMIRAIAHRDYAAGFASFTAGLIDPPVRTLADLVAFNKQHAEQAMPAFCPGQDVIEAAAANSDKLTDEEYVAYCDTVRYNNAVLGVDATLEKYNLDVIMGAPTGRSTTVYDMAGYPVGTLPLGYAEFNGRPFGMAVVAPRQREDLIVRVMGAWEGCLVPGKHPLNW